MLKIYLQINGISIYQLSKKTGIPYSTVNDLANNKTMAGNCKASIIQKLAVQLQVSMEELLDICDQSARIQTKHGSVEAYTYSKNEYYYVAFLDDNIKQELAVSPVCKDIHPFLQELIKWTVDSYLADKQLEVMADELLYHEKK
ncbi:MAG: helix-turn-helix transcriptional regulator [Clostridiales bacterium]|nr:helix-turn-helix transcriptional regulator [Clostridiales bacterium]